MEPGLFYISQLKPMFATADRAAKRAEKEKPQKLKATRQALLKSVRSELRLRDAKLTHDYDEGHHYRIAPGIEVHVDLSELRPHTHPSSASAYQNYKEVSKGSANACSKRCELADLMETKSINSFKAHVKSVYGKKPTHHELEDALRFFLESRTTHSCPIKKRN